MIIFHVLSNCLPGKTGKLLLLPYRRAPPTNPLKLWSDMKNPLLLATLCGAIMLQHGFASAASKVERHIIELTDATPENTLRGKIRGDDSAEYTVTLRRGQAFSVTLKSSSRSNYFNLTAPTGSDALFVGSRDGNNYRGTAAQGGDYKIHVYLMRNAARRGESASYVLSVGTRN